MALRQIAIAEFKKAKKTYFQKKNKVKVAMKSKSST